MGNRLIPTLATSTPPKAAAAFFEKYPHQATPFSFEVAPLPEWILQRVRVVNSYVNHLLPYSPDRKGFDEWEEAGIYDGDDMTKLLCGDQIEWCDPVILRFDCEDYVWTKRRILAHPFGYGCLSPIITTLHDGQGHMVLGLCASDTTWILDNLQDDVIEIKPAHRPRLMYANGAWCLCHIQEDTADA